ncbi:hypothetical protein AFAEC_1005 [Aliarcobacter faecis]|nr:hypothetical protein AFAEC_1005 [Aliarcobacter faecis]
MFDKDIKCAVINGITFLYISYSLKIYLCIILLIINLKEVSFMRKIIFYHTLKESFFNIINKILVFK